MSEGWERLRKLTSARVGLPRAGHALATRPLLELAHAHARARNAVHAAWDMAKLETELEALGEKWLSVSSAVTDRAMYLKRPDLGRALLPESRVLLERARFERGKVVFCLSDGLSATAVERHFFPFWKIFLASYPERSYPRYPLVLVRFGRVAIADAVGAALGAVLSVIFVGERPGMSAEDSLGCYLTYDPRPGRHDAERNCLSNIRPPAGMSYEAAAARLHWLIAESLQRRVSGVGLKESAGVLLEEKNR